MFSKYFEAVAGGLIKKPKTGKKDDKKTRSKGKKDSADVDILKETFNKIIPSHLIIDSHKMIDPSGYSPEEVDLIAYKQVYRDIASIMDGFIPCELVYGTYHIEHELNKENLMDMLRKVVQAKKINRFTDRETQPAIIPAFVVAFNSAINLADLKTLIIDDYMLMSADHASEVDIVAILNKGLIIKNWRDKRSYIALETGKDTLMWFFILMNEYLDVDKGDEFDPRNYVKHAEKYNEY